MTVDVMCKFSCEPKYLKDALKNANDEVAVYGAEFSILKEFPPSPQQPTSFVNAISAPESFWDEHNEGCIYDLAEMIKDGFPLLIDSGKYEVEQIGAVLYVRSKS